ncbi:hypothetical protein HO498_01330 [Streptococcus suis]|nr:hypothetical protein [Streptococcus suis]
MDKTIKLDLSALGEGGLQEKVDKELEKVFDNILDPNTDSKVARKLVITLTMKADDSREVVSTNMDVKSTLAPNPVTLRPYRTFAEVEQPASQFIYRIDKAGYMALFEADGGKWKLDAINNIATYLKSKLGEQANITILA